MAPDKTLLDGEKVLMDVTQILSAIDAEISRLQEARKAVATLVVGGTPLGSAARRGRPPKTAQASVPANSSPKRKRTLSPEGRKRIQEAMQRRWAARKKSDS